MKTSIYLFLFIFCFIHSIFTYSQDWNSQTSGITQNLNSVFFTDLSTGYIVGNGGKILKTANGGNTWILQTSGTTDNLYSAYFCNSSTGFAVGYGGTILKTLNGGDTWTKQSSGLSHFSDAGIPSIFFTDVSTGFFVSYYGVKKTTNGGSSWNSNLGNLNMNSIFFTDANTGYAVGGVWGNDEIIKTTNGGSTWVTQNSQTSQILNSVYFVNSDIGYAVGATQPDVKGNKVLKTINGGYEWISQSNGISFGSLESVYFIDENNGYAAGYITDSLSRILGGTIIKTLDGGNSWSKQTIGTNEIIQSIFFTDINTGYAVGNNGTILKTINGGINVINENTVDNNVKIYPNPASDIIYVGIDNIGNKDFTLDIFNSTGTLVKTEKLRINQNQINIRGLSNGIYVVKINSNGLINNQKLIIQR
jgi:photosystem II stability/assembly factor-like uncharacterized protein